MEKSNKAQIKVLGIGSAKDRALKVNLLAALEVLDYEAEVIEISDVDEILNHGISGIPAVLLDGKIIFQKIVPSAEELSIALKELLQYREAFHQA